MNKLIDAICANFDVNLNVNNEKYKRFDVADAIAAKMTNEINEFLVCFENVTNLNIEIFEIVFDEIVVEIVEIVVVFLFFFLLKRDFIVLIISFFTIFV